MTTRVMIVEDEEPLTELLRYNLEAEGYAVEASLRGDEAELKIREVLPDLILLDWMLPGVSGIELCRRLRRRDETRDLPIIMLTARGEETERIRGLSTGADDYVVKPFSVPELMARVRAILRRSRPETIATILKSGDLELDRQTHRVRRGGREMNLGPTEYRLLEFLMQSPGQVFSREQLLDGAWGREVYVDERTVDVHVGRLRKAINRGRAKDPIRTIRGAGYALDEQYGL
ncbi:MAG: phosphate regulon transcriptional regulator PhoB [Alphaproteobacteria bacterium]